MVMFEKRAAVLAYSTKNIGDDMQSLAARRFFPCEPVGLQRESLDSLRNYLGRYKLLMNGWFMRSPRRFPPAPTIDPLVISFHLSNMVPGRLDSMRQGRSLRWFKAQALKRGVGTRDVETMQLLHEVGVDAYFSGCLTMTMKAPPDIKKSDDILMIDVDDAAAAKLESITRQPFRKLTQDFSRHTPQPERLRLVTERFRDICSAKAIVTRRIHVAYPALAVGTPVLMVNDNPNDQRFSGVMEHLHFATPEDILAERYDFNFANPPPNKNTHLGLVKDMELRCEAFARSV